MLLKEEWIWVEGYKATHPDMTCMNNFQYELNKQYNMPEDEEIKICENGFHFCHLLTNVFNFYNYPRVFKVKALVRKAEWEQRISPTAGFLFHGSTPFNDNPYYQKQVAKSIVLIKEIKYEDFPKSQKLPFIETHEDYMEFLTFSDSRLYFTLKYEEMFSKYFSNTFTKQIILKNLCLSDLHYAYSYNVIKDFYDWVEALYSIPNISNDLRLFYVMEELNKRGV